MPLRTHEAKPFPWRDRALGRSHCAGAASNQNSTEPGGMLSSSAAGHPFQRSTSTKLKGKTK
jgi:hypothetical protein